MKSLRFLILFLFLAGAVLANTRAWQTAMVINMSETDVTSDLRAPKNIVHYTIETRDKVYFADFSYNPSQQGRASAPDIAVNEPIQVAIEGKQMYILDTAGREVKLHIVKRPAGK